MYEEKIYSGFHVIATYGCITIYDSHKTENRKQIMQILKQIAADNISAVTQKRTLKSLADEWIAHTRLYKLGIMRDHTADVDLEYPQNKLHSIVWSILGI